MIHSALTLETMRFLRSLTNDGELTGEEVWSLARWLMQHRSAWDAWPGKLLVEPLAAAFEDEQLSLEEMRSLAQLLSQIEHEWASQFKRQGSTRPVAPLPNRSATPLPGGRGCDPAFLLPSLDIKVPVDGDPGTFTVSLADHACECADWVVRRQQLPARTLGRCCKHVAEALVRHLASGRCEPWMHAVLSDCSQNGRGIDPAFDWHLLSGSQGTIAVAKGRNDWVNVFAPAEDGYQRFGFNTKEQRWAFGAAPDQDQEIIKTLQTCV
jgi:hypothetical protein